MKNSTSWSPDKPNDPDAKSHNRYINYQNLEPTSRHITFLAKEKVIGLKKAAETTLAQTNLSVCYVSSSEDDPDLQSHINVSALLHWYGLHSRLLFQTLQTNIMVMTMPDLHQYQIKRSQYKYTISMYNTAGQSSYDLPAGCF